MTHIATPSGDLSVEELPWPRELEPPPIDLPYEDGEPMESQP